MSTVLMREEKLAITLKDSVVKLHGMRVVITIKCKLKLREPKPIPFFSIVLGFLNLADHPIVHVFISFSKDIPFTTTNYVIS
jgi:hypothetical protein